MTKKIRSKLFTHADFDKEESYLREQHQQGWAFKRFYYPGFYVFEKCAPEDVIYRLDYTVEGKTNMNSYIQLFNDCGWEYLCDVNGWSYFKKPAQDLTPNEGIFNDAFSQLDMLVNVAKRKLLPCVILFFLIILPNIFLQYTRWHHSDELSTFSLIFLIVFLTMGFVYIVMFTKFLFRFLSLKKNTAQR